MLPPLFKDREGATENLYNHIAQYSEEDTDEDYFHTIIIFGGLVKENNIWFWKPLPLREQYYTENYETYLEYFKKYVDEMSPTIKIELDKLNIKYNRII